MIKPPITVTLKNNVSGTCQGEIYALEQNMDFLKDQPVNNMLDTIATKYHSSSTVCYIHVWEELKFGGKGIQIQAVGINRDLLKIHIKNLPLTLLRASSLSYNSEPFIVRPLEMPKHLWLRFDKSTMSID